MSSPNSLPVLPDGAMSIKFLAILLAGATQSLAVTRYDGASFNTNGGSQSDIAYHSIPSGQGPGFCTSLLSFYDSACKDSKGRCDSSPTNDLGDLIVFSASAQGHDFDDVEGCAGFAINQATAFAGLGFLPVKDDDSFDGCLVGPRYALETCLVLTQGRRGSIQRSRPGSEVLPTIASSSSPKG